MGQKRKHQEWSVDNAKIACAHSKSPVARLIEKGISRIGKPLEDINTAIENAGKLEIYKLEKCSAWLPFQDRTYDWFLGQWWE
jgi:biopolymer transport protein ExbB